MFISKGQLVVLRRFEARVLGSNGLSSGSRVLKQRIHHALTEKRGKLNGISQCHQASPLGGSGYPRARTCALRPWLGKADSYRLASRANWLPGQLGQSHSIWLWWGALDLPKTLQGGLQDMTTRVQA